MLQTVAPSFKHRVIMHFFILLVIGGVSLADGMATTDQIRAAASANRRFTVAFMKKISSGRENVFFSPYSISIAMAMTSLGAGGDTLAQIENAFYFNTVNTDNDTKIIHEVYKQIIGNFNQQNENYSLQIANRLFSQDSFEIKQKFQDDCKNYYHADLQQLHFDGTAETKINEWVEEQTNHKIKNLFKPGTLTSDTYLVLVNAVYFKGNWLSKFNKDVTQEENFNLADGSTRKVQMMYQKDTFGYYYDFAAKVKVLEMPYAGEELSMFIILPDEINGLQDFVQSFTLEKYEELISKVNKQTVEVKLPKFKLEIQYSLEEKFRELGIIDLFKLDAANVSIISDDKIQVSKVLHKSVLINDEEGSTAASVSAIGYVKKSLIVVEHFQKFYFKRPGLVVIMDKESGFILFCGSVFSPMSFAKV